MSASDGRRGTPFRALTPVVVLCLALVACTSPGGGVASSPGATGQSSTGGASLPAVSAVSSGAAVPPPSRADIDAAGKILAAVRLDDEDSINLVEDIRYSDVGAHAAREAIASGATGAKLWAATWVYATVGPEAAPLIPLLGNADASIRAIAAVGVISRGEPAGFKVLVDLLSVDQRLTGSHPPIRVWQYAAGTLERFTAAGLGPKSRASASEISSAAATWSAWLNKNLAALRFDRTTGTWKLG